MFLCSLSAVCVYDLLILNICRLHWCWESVCEECCVWSESLFLLLQCKLLCNISADCWCMSLSLKKRELMELFLTKDNKLTFIYAILMTNSHVKRVQGGFWHVCLISSFQNFQLTCWTWNSPVWSFAVAICRSCLTDQCVKQSALDV